MLSIPEVTTEVAFTTAPGSTSPVWVDISDHVKSCAPTRGSDSELSQAQPGTNSLVLDNRDRDFDSSFAAGPYFGNIKPGKRIRQYVAGPLIGTEFWGDFEAGAAGTAPEWTAMNGALECKAGSEARQLTFVTTPTPRLGAKCGRFEVASGDQFGATSGERCEVRRGGTNGGYGTGDLEGQIVFTAFSTRFLAPWTLTGEGIFQQTHDAGSTYGAPFFRWRMGSSSNIEFRVTTGNYANGTDASNGANMSTSFTHTGLAFATDTWFDFRHAIFYTQGQNGWYIAQMKVSTDTGWTTVAQMGSVQTLPSIGGAPSSTSQFDKQGFYRGTPQASTNVVFQDGYLVGHSWTDVSYTAFTTDSRWNDKGWEGREQAVIQVGNPDFEVDIVGTAAAGGGTTTRTWDTTRAKFGSGSLKMVTNGAASGQGAFHTKRSLSRYDGIVAGKTYTASCWYSGDGFEQVRIGIEWVDGASAVISTTFAPGRALRTDFRRHWITAVAPANAVTMRIRTSLTGTAAATFWVDGVDWWEGGMNHSLFEGYVESWQQSWPDGLFQSECHVQCTDAFKMFNNSGMPVSNPNVDNYADVLAFDEPSFHYPLGEPAGTRVSTGWRKRDRTRRHRHRFRGDKESTIAELTGVSGVAGTYKNTPTLGEPGLVVGDLATSVKFVGASSEYARAGPLDVDDLINTNRLTLEAIIKPTTVTGGRTIIAGPPKSSVTVNAVFLLEIDTSSKLSMSIRGTGSTLTFAGSTSLSTNTIYHVAATWDGTFIRIYLNGSLDGTSGSLGDTLLPGDVGEYLYLGIRRDATGAGYTSPFDGWMQHAAIYETQLSTARILAHSDARTRGFAQELSGTRVTNAIAASNLPSILADVDAGQRSVLPIRQAGQGTLDVINPAVEAEGGSSVFFVAGSGVATYRDRAARALYPYSTSQGTFGDLEPEIPYQGLSLSNDDSFLYNEIRLQRVNGELQTSTDATSQTNYLRRTYEASGLINISDANVATEAADLLARYKDPLERVTGLSFMVGGDAFDTTAQALCREIGDQVTVKRRPSGGAVITQASYIERISHAIDLENKTWETTLAISPR